MSLHQTLQANTRKANELFDKLLATSNQAVKTRETLFADLSRELRLHTDLQERHVFPALRKSEDTRKLVPDAAKANRHLIGELDALETLPKGDEAFQPRLAELRKLFRQHLRDERQELLAVEEELSEEQAEAVARKLEAGLAQAEAEQRQEADQRQAAARRERERERALAARKQAAEEAIESAGRNVREFGNAAADIVERGVKSAEQGSVKAVSAATDTARKAIDGVGEALGEYRAAARERGEDIKAVAVAFRTLGGVRKDVRAVFVGYLRQSARDGLESARRVLRHPLQLGDAQRDYAAAATRNWLETTSEFLQIARKATIEAGRPVEQRLREAA